MSKRKRKDFQACCADSLLPVPPLARQHLSPHPFPITGHLLSWPNKRQRDCLPDCRLCQELPVAQTKPRKMTLQEKVAKLQPSTATREMKAMPRHQLALYRGKIEAQREEEKLAPLATAPPSSTVHISSSRG